MRGWKRLATEWVARRWWRDEFWLADIRDSCIIGLDLLTCWRARLDMAGAAITVDAETVALQSGRGEHGGSGDQRSSRQVTPREPRPLHSPRPRVYRLSFPRDRSCPRVIVTQWSWP